MLNILKSFGNFFTLEPDADKAVKEFIKAEYKKDWQAAYQHYKAEGNLPNFIRRTL
jgi:hypothetical protein